MIVDEADRESLVAAIEKRVVETYGLGRDTPATPEASEAMDVTIVGQPRQRPGFVERVDTTYSVAKGPKAPTKQRRKQG